MEEADRYKRAHVMEWEHMMPAENFGRQLPCWQEKICSKANKPYRGRACCARMDSTFQKMEAELYNLWPAVGFVNQARSNYRFSPLEGTSGFFGCDFKVDKILRKVEPRDSAKGIVARANLFMSQKYQINISESQQTLFEIWNQQFPPDEWEIHWANEIEKIEGYSNHYIQNWG